MLRNVTNIIKQYTIYSQFVPKSKELKNSDLKEISNRLKGNSISKSLINILEWQDRNIKYWEERAVLSQILNMLAIFSIILIVSYLGRINPVTYGLLVFIPLLLIGNMTLNIVINLGSLLLMILFIPLLLSLSASAITVSSTNFLVFLGASFILGAFVSLFANLFFKYRAIKRILPNFQMDDTFRLSLSIEKILKYRFSICRDYAKLTSAFLLNLFPDKEVFFVLIPKHVAVAIKVDKQIWVLDQKLPILPLECWVKKWTMRFNVKKLKVDLIKIILEKEKIKISSIKLNETIITNISTKRDSLTKKLRAIFNLGAGDKNKNVNSFEIRLKSYSQISCSERMYEESLIESIKNRIEDEMAGNISNLISLDILQNNGDLIVKVWTK